MKWNVASFNSDGSGVDVVLTYACTKENCMNIANEMNRWMLERAEWKCNAVYIAFPVPSTPDILEYR